MQEGCFHGAAAEAGSRRRGWKRKRPAQLTAHHRGDEAGDDGEVVIMCESQPESPSSRVERSMGTSLDGGAARSRRGPQGELSTLSTLLSEIGTSDESADGCKGGQGVEEDDEEEEEEEDDDAYDDLQTENLVTLEGELCANYGWTVKRGKKEYDFRFIRPHASGWSLKRLRQGRDFFCSMNEVKDFVDAWKRREWRPQQQQQQQQQQQPPQEDAGDDGEEEEEEEEVPQLPPQVPGRRVLRGGSTGSIQHLHDRRGMPARASGTSRGARQQGQGQARSVEVAARRRSMPSGAVGSAVRVGRQQVAAAVVVDGREVAAAIECLPAGPAQASAHSRDEALDSLEEASLQRELAAVKRAAAEREQELRAEVKGLQGKVREAVAAASTYEQHCAEAEERLGALTQQMIEMEERERAAKEKAQKWRGEREAVQQQLLAEERRRKQEQEQREKVEQQLEQARQENESLDRQLISRVAALEAAEASREQLAREVESLKKQAEDVRVRRTDGEARQAAEGELERAEEKRQEMERELAYRGLLISKLRVEKEALADRLTAELAQGKRLQRDMQAAAEASDVRVKEAEAARVAAMAQLHEASGAVQPLEQQLREARAENESLQQQLASKAALLEAAEAARQRLANQLEGAMMREEDSMFTIEQVRRGYIEALQAAKGELGRAEERRRVMEQRHQEELGAAQAMSEAQAQQHACREERLEAQLSDRARAASAMQAKVSDLEKQLQRAKASAADRDELVQRVTAESRTLAEQLLQAHTNSTVGEAMENDFDAKLKAAKVTWAEEKRRLDATMTAELKKARAKMQGLGAEKESLQQQVQSEQHRNRELLEQLGEARAELEELKRKDGARRRQSQQPRKKVLKKEEQEKQPRKQQGEPEEAQTAAESLRQQVERLQADNLQLQADLAWQQRVVEEQQKRGRAQEDELKREKAERKRVEAERDVSVEAENFWRQTRVMERSRELGCKQCGGGQPAAPPLPSSPARTAARAAGGAASSSSSSNSASEERSNDSAVLHKLASDNQRHLEDRSSSLELIVQLVIGEREVRPEALQPFLTYTGMNEDDEELKAAMKASKAKYPNPSKKDHKAVAKKMDELLRNAKFNPFIKRAGKIEGVDEHNKELQAFETKHGRPLRDLLVSRLTRMEKVNPSGRYPEYLLWDVERDEPVASVCQVLEQLLPERPDEG